MLIEIIIGIFLLIASIIDIKTREVPNFLSYGLIVLVSYNTIMQAITEKTIQIILHSIYGLLIAGVLGYLLYRLGQWGGGDVKLIFSMGIFYGLQLGRIPDLAIFLILMFLSGGIIGIIYSLFMAITHWKKFKKKASYYLARPEIHRTRLIITPFVLLLIIISIITRNPLAYAFMAIAFVAWLGFFLWLIVKSVEEITMIKERAVSKLVEGDWLVKTIKGKGLKVEPREVGLTIKDLKKIKKMGLKKVMIKEGLPFVPSFFIAYVLMFFTELMASFLTALL